MTATLLRILAMYDRCQYVARPNVCTFPALRRSVMLFCPIPLRVHSKIRRTTVARCGTSLIVWSTFTSQPGT